MGRRKPTQRQSRGGLSVAPLFSARSDAFVFTRPGFQGTAGAFSVIPLCRPDVVKSALAGTPGSRPRVRNILSLQLANLCGELVEALARRGKSQRRRLEPLGRSA